MKILFIRALSIVLILSVTVTGCLKDTAFDNGQIQSVAGGNTKVIGLGLTVSNSSNFVTISVDASNNDTTFNLVPVTLGGPTVAPSDIHVTLVLSDTLISQYDTTNGTTYTVPLSSIYSFPNGLVVTIPKGSRTGFLAIKFKPSDFLTGNYALGFTITSIAESGYVIGGNYNSGIVALGVKNQYDGIYNNVGYFVHPSVGGPFAAQNTLVTSGSNSVDMSDGQPYSTGRFGVYPRLTVGASLGNGLYAVGVTDPTGSLPLFTAPVEAGYVNRYDANTKTFYINFGYTTSAPREATDTLTYLGPR